MAGSQRSLSEEVGWLEWDREEVGHSSEGGSVSTVPQEDLQRRHSSSMRSNQIEQLSTLVILTFDSPVASGGELQSSQTPGLYNYEKTGCLRAPF